MVSWPGNFRRLGLTLIVKLRVERIHLKWSAADANFFAGDVRLSGVYVVPSTPVSEHSTLIGWVVKPLTGNIERDASCLANQKSQTGDRKWSRLKVGYQHGLTGGRAIALATD